METVEKTPSFCILCIVRVSPDRRRGWDFLFPFPPDFYADFALTTHEEVAWHKLMIFRVAGE